jgi:DNA-binding LacI/PurR family transcriptional regulator
MLDFIKPNGISAFKNESIVSHIRHQIIEGELSPGVQLPTRNELERRYQVSRDTVQRALDRLAEEEFVYTNGRRGTYVSQYPPHLCHYALVFESHPGKHGGAWSEFEETLKYAAGQRPQTPGQRLSAYYDIGKTTQSADYRRLEQEVADHRLAGLIFTFDPARLRGTVLMEDPRVARVVIWSEPLEMPRVTFNMSSFLDRALDFLISRGRRRVALISHEQSSSRDNQYFAAGVAARGLIHHRCWTQTANVKTAESADECAHLLMHSGWAERPDALIIDNDNLAAPAIRGLLAAGVRVPEDVEVVAHANYPLRTRLPVPVTRLGFDTRQILEACFDSIAARQESRPFPGCVTIGTKFESETSPY